MKNLIGIIILIAIFSCEKKDENCYVCYENTMVYNGNVLPDLIRHDSINLCDITQTEIDIFESQNNRIDSIGYGISWECFKK